MNKTVVISCAGKGSRLGLNIPKCLVDIDGKMLIERQLELLKDIDEIIIVVGYKADEVIKRISKINDKVKFVINNDYEKTATGYSFILGAKKARNNFIIALDGDMLVHPSDMNTILATNEEFVCGEEIHTENPVFINLNEDNKTIGFSRNFGELEWSGIAGIKKEHLPHSGWYVYNVFEPLLPLKTLIIRAREIDTPNDYAEAIRWIRNDYDDDKIIDDFFKKRFKIKDNYIASRYSQNDRAIFDTNFIKGYINEQSLVLDLGCGTGILEQHLAPLVAKITAVDKYQEFIDRAFKAQNIEYIVSDFKKLILSEEYDTVLLFGLTMYLSDEELKNLFIKVFNTMKEEAVFIIKNQFGIEDEVIVNKFSEELDSIYYAKYRKLSDICSIIRESGFSCEVFDIYPNDFNRYKNTHEYALLLRKKQNENS